MALSRAQRKLKRPEEALGTARAAVGVVRTIADAAVKRPAFATPRDVTTAYAHLALLHAEAGEAAASWDAIEEMRARALRNAVASNEREISRGMTMTSGRRNARWKWELTALHVQRDRLRAQAAPDEERAKKLDAAMCRWRKNAPRSFSSCSRVFRSWRSGAGWHPPRRLPISRRKSWKTGSSRCSSSSMIASSSYDRVTRRRGHRHRGLRCAVETALARRVVARAADVIGLSDPERWRKAAAETLKSLPPHLFERMSSAKKVLIVPDDMLWRVPFEALPVKSGYLADATRVTYAASLTALVKPPRVAVSEPLPFRVALVASTRDPRPCRRNAENNSPTWTLPRVTRRWRRRRRSRS